MPPDGPKNSAVRELESLRIARAEPKRRSRLLPIAIILVVLALLAGAGYEVYLRTLGRPPEVQTAMVTVRSAGQPGVMLTGSGYVVTKLGARPNGRKLRSRFFSVFAPFR